MEPLSNLPLKLREFKARRCLYFDEKLERNYSIFDLNNPELHSIYRKDINLAYKYFIDHYVEEKFIPSFEQNKLWKNTFKLNSDAYLVNIQPWLYPKEF